MEKLSLDDIENIEILKNTFLSRYSRINIVTRFIESLTEN